MLSQIAEESAKGAAPLIIQQYEDAKRRAKASGMSEKMFNTNFGDVKSIEALRKFLPKKPKGYEKLSPEEQEELKEYVGLPVGFSW